MLNCFLVISKSINFVAHLSKWQRKNKGPTRERAKSQLNLLKVTVTVTLTSYFFKMATVNVTYLLFCQVTVTVTQLLLQSNLPIIVYS